MIPNYKYTYNQHDLLPTSVHNLHLDWPWVNKFMEDMKGQNSYFC